MITIDPRMVHAKKLDKTRTVLVDVQSLTAANRILAERSIPTFDVSFLAGDSGRALANIIQTVVLYDTVVVDSVLLDSHSDVWLAFEFFPDFIRGVYIPALDRIRIGHLVQQATSGWDDMPPGLLPEDWFHMQRQSASEKPVLDAASHSCLHRVPPGCEDDPELRRMAEHEQHLPLCVLNSTRTLSRAHFYLELARDLGIPLVVDPIRSRYFEVLFQKIRRNIKEGTPEKILARFDSAQIQPEVDHGLVSIDMSIPAVAELVLRFAKRKKCALLEATIDIRESRHARMFRDWCAKFALLEQNGRPGAKEQVEMLAHLDEVCRVWRRDINENVKYRTRKVNLEHLPFVGGVLKALNMHETLTIKDPVLGPPTTNPYFIFLNDLLQP